MLLCERERSSLPRQVDVCLLHDSQPGQQRLQVVLTGQVVVQSLRIKKRLHVFHTTFCTLSHALIFFALAHRDDLRVEFWGERGSVRLPTEQLMEGLHGTRRHQLQPETQRADYWWRWTNGIWLHLRVCLCSHHMAECHHSQQSLATGLDSSQRKRAHQLLQKTQHMKCSGVLFAT